ncbi:hypothetical protein DUNSADRAFT_15527 [Dunaliella salina]|uniref:Uncharacterized protein n=1 Tax=Dunaliella salina TaxID=3046 RepID=A0ABQ7G5G0_DUNSA|nr:hypothetical protein DUNSADRAFT_15527 [Dunaliella salina]|eukprot:KAF5829781.1 hypothetical protein DUNSADRAFT_15527 [Dunaliella salina]
MRSSFAALALLAIVYLGAGTQERELLEEHEFPRCETILGQEGNNATAIHSKSGFWSVVDVPDEQAIYYTRDQHYVIEKFDFNTTTVSVVSGDPGNNGNAVGSFSEAAFDLPRYMTYSPEEHALFVADTMNIRVKKLDLANMEVTTAAGTGDTGYSDGEATQSAKFADSNSEGGPQALVTLDGAVYAADSNNNAVRKLQNETVSTLAELSSNNIKPWSLALDPINRIMFIAERDGSVVYSLIMDSCDANGSGCNVSTIAGKSGDNSIVDGQGRTEDDMPGEAAFSQIKSLVYDPSSSMLYAGEFRVIRAINTSMPTYNVSTVAGDKATEGFQDGTDCRVRNVLGMAVDTQGNLIFTDRNNARIRRVLFQETVAPSPAPSPDPVAAPPPPAGDDDDSDDDDTEETGTASVVVELNNPGFTEEDYNGETEAYLNFRSSFISDVSSRVSDACNCNPTVTIESVTFMNSRRRLLSSHDVSVETTVSGADPSSTQTAMSSCSANNCTLGGATVVGTSTTEIPNSASTNTISVASCMAVVMSALLALM